MTPRNDPTYHRDREKDFFEHARRLLEDDRLRPETRFGRRPITALMPRVTLGEPGVERGERLKRTMLELGVADRELQSKMPVGERMGVGLNQRFLFFFNSTVGRLKVICVPPTRDLLKGETPRPLDAAEVQNLLAESSKGAPVEMPVTTVLMSSAGFTREAADLARAAGGGRAAVLVEPNEAGGWSVHAPEDAPELATLFDPEQDADKRNRVREYLKENHYDIVAGGVGADRVAAKTQLPLQIVEAELKSFAREEPGLAAKKIEGRLTLFREGSAITAGAGGLSNMPFWERVTGIFKREESTERKIARLSAERAALGAQRERAYDEIASVERRESELAKSFQGATQLAQRRIATEISQLRKDIERRQQILGAIDKKVNVINTGIHTLELKQQVDPERLKTLENITASTEDVEEGMAALQQLDEEANSVAGLGSADVPDDVQSILDELRGTTGEAAGPAANGPVSSGPAGERSNSSPQRQPTTAVTPERRRNEPEAG